MKLAKISIVETGKLLLAAKKPDASHQKLQNNYYGRSFRYVIQRMKL